MSYILDALRKADQQRQHSAAPTRLTVQATAAPKQPAFLFYGLLAVVLIGAGTAIGWLRPWQPDQPAVATGPIVAQPVPPLPTSAVVEHDKAALTRKKSQSMPPKVVAAVPNEAATSVPEKPVGTVRTDTAQEPRVMTMAELPPAIQQEIPRMSISVHAYSGNPKDRLVGINDRLLREGENLAPGLRLEQITLDGMIFSYKEYRFSRKKMGSE